MAPKVLYRCDVCKRLHAEYRVTDRAGRPRRLCYRCWKALQATGEGVAPQVEPEEKDKDANQDRIKPGHS